jgi:hypothetical protein
MRNACRVSVGKPEGKSLLGRPTCRWETILKLILQKYDGRVWTGLIDHRTGRNSGILQI